MFDRYTVVVVVRGGSINRRNPALAICWVIEKDLLAPIIDGGFVASTTYKLISSLAYYISLYNSTGNLGSLEAILLSICGLAPVEDYGVRYTSNTLSHTYNISFTLHPNFTNHRAGVTL